MLRDIQTESYLNASEHQFNLSFSEILLLRDYCRTNGIMFCSTMGGCESIRDLQESKYLGAEAIEFPFIESLFALSKIFTALEKVFLEEKEKLSNYKLFINIGSTSGINMLLNNKHFNVPSFIQKNNIVFTFDRIKLVREIFSIRTKKINLHEFEVKINNFISESIQNLEKLGFSHCVSGAITTKSVAKLNEMLPKKPDYIKIGLFTIRNSALNNDERKKEIQIYQSIEAKLLNLMLDVLNNKGEYLNERILSINNDIYESL